MRSMSFARRMERAIDKLEPVPMTGCWLWPGATNDDGYAVLYFAGKKVGLHRLMYQYQRGPIPEGMSVLHRCDVPACVNPDHLWLGSQLENIADRHRKCRSSRAMGLRGETNPNARITEEEAGIIRHFATAKQAMDTFGLGPTQVYRIKRGLRWRN